uniref:Uncharacterized protein n=1 Tax=Panagrolaimus davidi TaxID=227884 RepID=A0A914PBJ0_9BILA
MQPNLQKSGSNAADKRPILDYYHSTSSTNFAQQQPPPQWHCPPPPPIDTNANGEVNFLAELDKQMNFNFVFILLDIVDAFEKKYGKAISASIDIDPELRYPKGAARIVFAI